MPVSSETIQAIVVDQATAARLVIRAVPATLPAPAIISAGVTDAQASSLPTGGLMALHALRKGGLLLGHQVVASGSGVFIGTE